MILCSDARRIPLRSDSIQCVVTSPPYWGLRKYAGEQELVWGGLEDCEHEWGDLNPGSNRGEGYARAESRGSDCLKCGAWRGAFGLEPTVEMYVQHTVEILREIRRVLREDGVVFWNIGDSYAGSGPSGASYQSETTKRRATKKTEGSFRISKTLGERGLTYAEKKPIPPPGLKSKDLCLIPFRVALAAQADGWWVRSAIAWAKPNPMPESVHDRPTDAYEFILMLTKSATYFWDAEAVAEPLSSDPNSWGRHSKKDPGMQVPNERPMFGPGRGGRDGTEWGNRETRNLRNVWTFPTRPYKGAHFAVFPEELVRRCLRATSKPLDLVLDPFAGTGTVGMVATKLGRRAILCDLAYQHQASLRLFGVQREILF